MNTIKLPSLPGAILPSVPPPTEPRDELLLKFARHVYGFTPDGDVRMISQQVSDQLDIEKRARRREITLTLERGSRTVDLHLLVYMPIVVHEGTSNPGSGITENVPAFLGLNFGGNQTLEDDSTLRISTSYTIAKPGVQSHLATDETRGSAISRWPIREIVSRGYALVTLHCGDVRPDNGDLSEAGVQTLFSDCVPGQDDERWGTIGSWAWGLSRVLDFLRDFPGIDEERVIVFGHSRLGKAALWAGAQDTRFAGVISNDSGCGGAAIYRRCVGERIHHITERFPDWFCRAHTKYRRAEETLPVDQHMLLALIAPRMLHVGSATEDFWADPDGEFLSAIIASEAYRKLGYEALPQPFYKALNTSHSIDTGIAAIPPVGGVLRYHRRNGSHDITTEDWLAYLDHADDYFA